MAIYSRKRTRSDYVTSPEIKSVGYILQDDQWNPVPNEPTVTGPHFFGLVAAVAPPGVKTDQLCKPLCINVVFAGSEGMNRIGSVINMKKLSVKVIAIRQANGVVDGDSQSLLIRNRLMIVYDRGGDRAGDVGFSPPIYKIINVPNPAGADYTAEIWADQSPYFTERFEILYDSFRVAPSNNQTWSDPGQPWSQWTFDIDLEDRQTVYNNLQSWDPTKDRAQNIVTGGLYLVCAGTGVDQDQPFPAFHDPAYKVIGQVTLYYTG